MKPVAAVIPAAGLGQRLGASVPKAFYVILGKPLLIHTLLQIQRAHNFEDVVVSVDPKEMSGTLKLLKKFKIDGVRLVAGGQTRAESVRNAVNSIRSSVEWVLIHDAARPMLSAKVVEDALKEASRADGAIAAIPVSSTVKKANIKSHQIISTEDRSCLYLAQTPQVFKIAKLKDRYRVLGTKIRLATDEAALFDGTRARIRLSGGDVRNIKITTPEDVELIKYYLTRQRSG